RCPPQLLAGVAVEGAHGLVGVVRRFRDEDAVGAHDRAGITGPPQLDAPELPEGLAAQPLGPGRSGDVAVAGGPPPPRPVPRGASGGGREGPPAGQWATRKTPAGPPIRAELIMICVSLSSEEWAAKVMQAASGEVGACRTRVIPGRAARRPRYP